MSTGNSDIVATNAASLVCGWARAVRAGRFAPTFRLEDLHGGTAAMVDLIQKGPLVISFYRGLWCSFCELALEAFARADEEVRKLGASHVAIGPPSANQAQQDRLSRFPMPMLADPASRVAGAYGLTVKVPEALREQYTHLGYAPANNAWLVPIPATYVLDESGRIVLAAVYPDYRNRLGPKEILFALRCLRRRSNTDR